MVNIIHRVGIKASSQKVYEALSTIKGISDWWTTDTTGESEIGKTIVVRFNTPDGNELGSMAIEVQDLKSAEKVNETTWNLTGTYTIAGVSKEHKTQVKTSVANGIVNLNGSDKITFKEFGMKSPTAMLGTIKTGEDLTIKFNLNFK